MKIKNNYLKKTIGIFLIVLGVISLVIPFSPGWLLIFAGLVLLEWNVLKNIKEKIKKKLKKMTEEQLILVDENDSEIGQAPKSEVTEKNLLHRGTDIIVLNSKNEIFVHQRTHNKLIYPGHYDICAGGGVNPGETYEENAKRELEEELGIKNIPLQFLFKFRLSDPDNPAFASVFKCVYDGSIKTQEKEIIHGKFMSITEIKNLMKTEKFTPESIEVFKKYLEEYHEH